MKKAMILLAMTFATALQGLAQRHYTDEKECCEHDQRHSGRHGVYVCDNFNVYYNGRKVADASVNTFMELGRSYAKDAFNVYYKGRKISNASPNTFQVLRNGYAKDAFNAYYRGREINNAYVNTFEVLGDGYAHDTFNTYYNGKKID